MYTFAVDCVYAIVLIARRLCICHMVYTSKKRVICVLRNDYVELGCDLANYFFVNKFNKLQRKLVIP